LFGGHEQFILVQKCKTSVSLLTASVKVRRLFKVAAEFGALLPAGLAKVFMRSFVASNPPPLHAN